MSVTALPRLSRSAPAPRAGVVHLGLGAFFRAHGALYLEEAMAASGGNWGVIGVSLRSPAQRDRLAPQGWAYGAVERAPGPRPRIVEVLAGVLWAPGSPKRCSRPSPRPRHAS
jgi:fructuronate reductase